MKNIIPASGASEQSKLAQQAKKYKFDPLCHLFPTLIKIPLGKMSAVCLSHLAQAHPHEFLDGQDLGFKTAQNFMFVKNFSTVNTWCCNCQEFLQELGFEFVQIETVEISGFKTAQNFLTVQTVSTVKTLVMQLLIISQGQ